MARRPSPDTTIGERIKTRRDLRDWSIRYAASRAGISHATWSRIERGLQGADNRFTLADIAAALECSVADLTGAPMPSTDRETVAAQASVHAIRRALVAIDLAESSEVQPRPTPELERETALIRDLSERCDYAGVGRLLPRLLRELHAAAAGPDRASALRMLAAVTFAASMMVRYVGYPAESWLAAERCREAAEAIEDPAVLAFAAFCRSHAATSCGEFSRAYSLASRATDVPAGFMELPAGPHMLGLLQLTCAFASVGDKRPGDSAGWLAEADALAARTGDTVAALGLHDLHFGPTNVKFWRVAMGTDGCDPGGAVEVARGTNPSVIPSVSRQTHFYVDTARALSRVRKDREAIRYLLTAERTAPQWVHSSPLVKETARALRERSRRQAGGSELRGLCERMGVVA